MISCKEYFESEKAEIKNLIERFNLHFSLNIYQVGDNPASNVYIRGKMKDCEEVGIETVLHKYTEDITQCDLEEAMSSDSGSNSVMIQLPVPDYIDPSLALVNSTFPYQDVDGISNRLHTPCTARGIIDWLEVNQIELSGKNVVVIGRGEIAGKAIAEEMLKKDATVTLCHSHTSKEHLAYLCSIADIIVVAVGKPEWFNMYCPQAIVIDVGITRGEDNKLHGDVKPGLRTKYTTPVPGGVGLLTRLALLKNIIE